MLHDIQRVLEKHFADLAGRRRLDSYPVYAIEHGLASEQIQALRSAASQTYRNYGLSRTHLLVWTALAAEAGYNYSGEEYWPELASTKFEWRSNQDRTQLRDFFIDFRIRFGGPKPVGRWAAQFNNISWPIANAILPRYLQSYFARHLFELRYDVVQLGRRSPEEIGAFLYERYDRTSSRFTDFLQQTDLTGRIVLALWDEDQAATDARITGTILNRIVSDLSRRRDARDYLDEARRVIRGSRMTVSARIRGANPPPLAIRREDASPQNSSLAARRDPNGSFRLGASVPDFASALKRAGLQNAALNSVRMRLSGETERWSPGLALLTLSNTDQSLSAFPSPRQPMIELEGTEPSLNSVLLPLCHLIERPCWVLRRHADGMYREVAGSDVRAGRSYLILSRSELPTTDVKAAGLARSGVNVPGIFAYAFEPVAMLAATQREALSRLRIGCTTGVYIEPIGINPRLGERQNAEWLSTEAVTIRVTVDDASAQLATRLDDQPVTTFSAGRRELVLLLDGLSVGFHTVAVTAIVAGRSAQSGTFDFTIAAPLPWTTEIRSRAGFRVILNPPNPPLEHLIEGQAQLGVIGPVGRKVAWSVETFDASGHRTASQNAGTTWIGGPDAQFVSLIDRIGKMHDLIGNAHRIDLVASIDELGRQSVHFPRVVEPLRWHFDAAARKARLIDETAHDSAVIVHRYNLSTPLDKQLIALTEATTAIDIAPPGAMLTAAYRQETYSLFMSTPTQERLSSFADMRLPQSAALPNDDAVALIKLIRGLIRWSDASPVGVLSIVRKRTTIERVHQQIADVACGREFAELVKSSHPSDLDRAREALSGPAGFRSRMRSHAWSPSDHARVCECFHEYARLYGVETDRRICDDAVALAFRPQDLKFDNIQQAIGALRRALNNRRLIRGAFLARAVSLLRQPAEVL